MFETNTTTEGSAPLLKSEAEDLTVFFAEEALESILQDTTSLLEHVTQEEAFWAQPDLSSRGVRKEDARRQLHPARLEALQKTAMNQRALGHRMWVALKHSDNKAEALATNHDL